MITGSCPKKTNNIDQDRSGFIENFRTYEYIYMCTKFESFYASKRLTLTLSVKL